MSTFVTFRGYAIGAVHVTVDVDRITHFHSVDYNGRSGVTLHLDTGAEVTVDGYEHDVKKAIREAQAKAGEGSDT